jgi:hypothetical protein
MSAWSHLPNAVHIDRVIVSLKAHSEIWHAAYSVACDAAAAYGAAWHAANDAAWDAAQGVILALVVYDDATKYLDMTVDQLKM